MFTMFPTLRPYGTLRQHALLWKDILERLEADLQHSLDRLVLPQDLSQLGARYLQLQLASRVLDGQDVNLQDAQCRKLLLEPPP